MAGTATNGGDVVGEITAIRDRWHTKNHPMFQAMAKGEIELRALAIYMAMHAKYVRYGLEAFGLMYARAPSDVRKMLVENMAEEEGLLHHVDHGADAPAHDHMEMIYSFCEAAGMTRQEVMQIEMTPAWWGRALYYLNVARSEPIGVTLAMQFTQEGQMPALNSEVIIPAFEKHYGYKRGDRAIEFFTEHELADQEHSRRQMELAARYVDSPELLSRAKSVAQQMCRLRWGCTTETYNIEVRGQKELLPAGVN